jgi:hypothetical protein
VDLGFALDALLLETAVVDPHVETCLFQGTIDDLGPLLAHGQHLGRTRFLGIEDADLGSQALCAHDPCGHQDMGVVIALVAPAVGLVDGPIHGHTVACRQPPAVFLDEAAHLPGVQLLGQGDFHLPGHGGILALLRGLGGVPEGRAIPGPVGCPIGHRDAGHHHPTLAGVVVDHPLSLVLDPARRTIGRRRRRRAPGRARDCLHGTVVNRHDHKTSVSPKRRKGALVQTPFACGQGFAPTPHSPAPTGDHPTERRPRRSRGRSGDQHGRLRSGGRTGGPPCEGPQPKAGDGAAARSAPRTAASHALRPPRRPESLRGQIWGLSGLIEGQPLVASPLPPRPPSPGACAGTTRPAHGKHSALWAVAPARSRQAAPLPVRCSLCS